MTMSRSKRCLDSCLRTLRANHSPAHRPSSVPRVSLPASTRWYGQATATRQTSDPVTPASLHEPLEKFRTPRQQERREQRASAEAPDDDFGAFGTTGASASVEESSARLAEHLNGLFEPLRFPPDLAHRVLTHTSHVSAKHGSNAGLSFTGRRVMECYLNLFLTGSKALQPTDDLLEITTRALNLTLLGELGSIWGFSKVLQWTPAVSRYELESATDPEQVIRRIGLHKVHGDAVAAVVGAIYMQFGASVAHRVFHARVLPHLLRGGLPTAFHAEAQALAQRMGGDLLHPSSS